MEGAFVECFLSIRGVLALLSVGVTPEGSPTVASISETSGL